MYEITYVVFIRHRGPFGISIPLPRFRTAHVSHPMKPFQRFDLADVLFPEKEEMPYIPHYLKYPTPVPGFERQATI